MTAALLYTAPAMDTDTKVNGFSSASEPEFEPQTPQIGVLYNLMQGRSSASVTRGALRAHYELGRAYQMKKDINYNVPSGEKQLESMVSLVDVQSHSGI